MLLRKRLRIVISLLICFLLRAEVAANDEDENKPYEFGFDVVVEGTKQQHRHEKKDKDGIIMGEFGFLTADDVYHVTVYATTKEGDFKILSTKNINLKSSPLPASLRQGHSLPLSAPVSTATPSTPGSKNATFSTTLTPSTLVTLTAGTLPTITTANSMSTVPSQLTTLIASSTVTTPVVSVSQTTPIEATTLSLSHLHSIPTAKTPIFATVFPSKAAALLMSSPHTTTAASTGTSKDPKLPASITFATPIEPVNPTSSGLNANTPLIPVTPGVTTERATTLKDKTTQLIGSAPETLMPFKLMPLEPPGKSCAGCSIPTTTPLTPLFGSPSNFSANIPDPISELKNIAKLAHQRLSALLEKPNSQSKSIDSLMNISSNGTHAEVFGQNTERDSKPDVKDPPLTPRNKIVELEKTPAQKSINDSSTTPKDTSQDSSITPDKPQKDLRKTFNNLSHPKNSTEPVVSNKDLDLTSNEPKSLLNKPNSQSSKPQVGYEKELNNNLKETYPFINPQEHLIQKADSPSPDSNHSTLREPRKKSESSDSTKQSTPLPSTPNSNDPNPTKSPSTIKNLKDIKKNERKNPKEPTPTKTPKIPGEPSKDAKQKKTGVRENTKPSLNSVPPTKNLAAVNKPSEGAKNDVHSLSSTQKPQNSQTSRGSQRFVMPSLLSPPTTQATLSTTSTNRNRGPMKYTPLDNVKPTLFTADFNIVDRNTDIHALRPGEKPGLPDGLDLNDMSKILYTFNYTVGFHGHFEQGYANGTKKGYYYVTGRNGVRTKIDYVADDTGFHPKVSKEVLDLLSDDVPKPETEKDAKFGLKNAEFKWLYYPVESKESKNSSHR